MGFELKTLSKAAIPKSLERVERYRLLNEPRVAESICLDILAVEPQHQQALIMLVLALTDQFGEGDSAGVDRRALELVPRLDDEYNRLYYTGIIYERQAKARLKRGYPGAGFDAYELYGKAMALFEEADQLDADVEGDAVLRWNCCARALMQNNLQPRPAAEYEAPLE